MEITEILPTRQLDLGKTRVAAYARVSSDKDAAFHSLEAQTEYYEHFISLYPDWELVGIYSDNGISGTIIERPEFQRMLEDCRAGKIDLVVTKSITRFARNTVILLETIRELKALGIDCYFEKEDMHSISPDGELLLTLLAMFAEEEARSASENQKWRIKKLYEQGKPAGGHTYGYRLNGETFEIVPEEAEIVREIFAMYLSGMGYEKIAKTLIERGVPSPRGVIWAYSGIQAMLKNEKYMGTLLLQKTFTPDFRTKKKYRNNGQVRKVRVKKAHEPIIDPETFEAVQKEIERRNKEQKAILEHKTSDHNHRNKLFTGLIICEECGGTFVRKHTNQKKGDKPVWVCQKYFRYGKLVCASQKIPEAILIEKTKEVLGVEDLSREVILQRIKQIRVPEHFCLTYELRDGTSVEVRWEHPSRRGSWTEEMRQAARERTLKQYGKEDENENETGN